MLDTMETMALAGAVVLGILLGAFYFGGLWWTVRRMPQARHPLNLYFGSLFVRLAITMSAFFGVLILSDWRQLLASLVGFVAVRVLSIRVLGNWAQGGAPTSRAA